MVFKTTIDRPILLLIIVPIKHNGFISEHLLLLIMLSAIEAFNTISISNSNLSNNL